MNELFEKAAEKGLHVEMRSVDMSDILKALEKDWCVVIILVDTQLFENGCTEAGEKLKKRRQEGGAGGNKEEDLVGARLPHSLPSNVDTEAGFVGHYVVLIRHLESEDLIEVADPGVGLERRIIGKNSLEKARKAHGTDEDMLVINVGSVANKRHTPEGCEEDVGVGGEGGRLGSGGSSGGGVSGEAGAGRTDKGTRASAGRNQRARPT